MTLLRIKLVAVAVFAAGVGATLFVPAQAQPPAPPTPPASKDMTGCAQAPPPVAPPAPACGVTPAADFTVTPNPTKLPYCKFGKMDGKYTLDAFGQSDDYKPIVFKYSGKDTTLAKIQVAFTFKYNCCPFKIPIKDPIGKDDMGQYNFKDLRNLTKTVTTQYLNPFGPFSDTTNPNPLAKGQTVCVTVTGLDTDGNPLKTPISVKLPLDLTFDCNICLPP